MLSILQGLAIDAAGIGIFGWLLKRDLDARDKQIARMTREEDLGSLQIELANKKTLRLAQLRQFVRIVSRLLLLDFQYLCCVEWSEQASSPCTGSQMKLQGSCYHVTGFDFLFSSLHEWFSQMREMCCTI